MLLAPACHFLARLLAALVPARRSFICCFGLKGDSFKTAPYRNVAFAYSFSFILIEIEVSSSPAQHQALSNCMSSQQKRRWSVILPWRCTSSRS